MRPRYVLAPSLQRNRRQPDEKTPGAQGSSLTLAPIPTAGYTAERNLSYDSQVFDIMTLMNDADFQAVSFDERSLNVGHLEVLRMTITPGPVHTAPILIVHGRCHSAAFYRSWLSLFAASGWEASAMSLRSHGNSLATCAIECVTLEDYVEDVIAVIDSLGEPPVLIGHSLGGMLVQLAALERPCSALVLAASVPPASISSIKPDLPKDASISDRQWYLDKGGSFIANLVVPESTNALNAARSQQPPEQPIGSRPVLVVGGELDETNVGPPEILARYYGGDAAVISGADHDLMLGEPGVRAAILISRWLTLTLLNHLKGSLSSDRLAVDLPLDR